MPSFAERRDLANQVAETKDALGAGQRDFDVVSWLLTDPKEGLLTVLGAGGPGAAIGGGLRAVAKGPSPKLVQAAKGILARLSKGPLTEEPAWPTDLPSDIARAVEGTVGATLQRYRPPPTPDIAQRTGKLAGSKASEYIVSKPDLEQALMEEVQKKLSLYKPEGGKSILSFLWNPLRNRASEEARSTLSRTSLPAANSLEMEAARLKKLYASRREDVTVEKILEALKAQSPRTEAVRGQVPQGYQADAAERVASGLTGQRGVDLETPGVTPKQLQEGETPESVVARAQEKVKLLKAMTTLLTPRQQASLSMYYGLADDRAMTLDEIAKALNPEKPLSKGAIFKDINKARAALAKEFGVALPDEAKAASLTEAARTRAASVKPPSYENVAGNVVVTDPGVAPATGGSRPGVGSSPPSGPLGTIFSRQPVLEELPGPAERALARKNFGNTPVKQLDPSQWQAIKGDDGVWRLVQTPQLPDSLFKLRGE